LPRQVLGRAQHDILLSLRIRTHARTVASAKQRHGSYEFTIQRYRKRGARVWLQAENPAYADITITEEMSFEICGVIKRVIRILQA
jgi:SOS-response transcriptional repressor LexA